MKRVKSKSGILYRRPKKRWCPVCNTTSNLRKNRCPKCRYRYSGQKRVVTEKDKKIMALLFDGHSYAETARRLAVSRQHVHKVAKKLKIVDKIREIKTRKSRKEMGEKILKKQRQCKWCGVTYVKLKGVTFIKYCSLECQKAARAKQLSGYQKKRRQLDSSQKKVVIST